MEEKGLRKALTYHSFNKNAVHFQNTATEIFERTNIDTDVLRIDGKMTSSERDGQLEQLKITLRSTILANCRVLTAGFNLPASTLSPSWTRRLRCRTSRRSSAA
mmetsp:Transcript_19338/g.49154  ORF Transcript_19338/g.49154 Transcript_19338/m.49154 type:complete len:104 (-) Transcript_19338:174-485(-)